MDFFFNLEGYASVYTDHFTGWESFISLFYLCQICSSS